MFVPQTSFIPVTVALTKFIEANGFDGLYPFWYLGTTPTKYLIGPVVPSILIFLHKIFPALSFFDLSYLLLLVSFFLFAAGWGFLVAVLSKKRSVGLTVGILCLFLPWRFFPAMAFGEVSAVFASALTPWVLLAFARIFNFQFSIFNLLLPSLAIALLLLTNSTASIPAIVGLLILGVLLAKNWGEGVKSAFMVIIVGWILATIWYGIDFWLISWGSPSIGGRTALSAFVTFFNLLRSFVPIILVIVLVLWKIRPKTAFEKFTLCWLVIFGSLTLFRFMADPDFLLDWTAWMGEVEVGLAMVMARNFQFPISNFQSIFNFQISKSTIFLILFSIYFFVAWFFVFQNRDLWFPRSNIENSVELRIANKLNEMTKPGERVFLSGTTAFWLNSLVDVAQVRGGRDEVSVDEKWRDIVWEVRQGVSQTRAIVALEASGIDYLVVHTNKSREYYHDFENPQGFEGLDSLEEVYDHFGDRIYKIK